MNSSVQRGLKKGIQTSVLNMSAPAYMTWWREERWLMNIDPFSLLVCQTTDNCNNRYCMILKKFFNENLNNHTSVCNRFPHVKRRMVL